MGLDGALIGGLMFNILNIDLGLGELKVSFEDVVSAFVGSLMLLIACWNIRTVRKKKS